MALDARSSRSISARAGGAPSRSQTTDIASGWARSFTTSTGPPRRSGGVDEPVHQPLDRADARAAIRRGVKYFFTTRRKTS